MNEVMDLLRTYSFYDLILTRSIIHKPDSSMTPLEVLVSERACKLRNLLTVMGCDPLAYWVGHASADLLIFMIPTFIVWVFIWSLQLGNWTKNGKPEPINSALRRRPSTLSPKALDPDLHAPTFRALRAGFLLCLLIPLFVSPNPLGGTFFWMMIAFGLEMHSFSYALSYSFKASYHVQYRVYVTPTSIECPLSVDAMHCSLSFFLFLVMCENDPSIHLFTHPPHMLPCSNLPKS